MKSVTSTNKTDITKPTSMQHFDNTVIITQNNFPDVSRTSTHLRSKNIYWGVLQGFFYLNKKNKMIFNKKETVFA